MGQFQEQIDGIKTIIKRHSKYTHFSGVAVIVTGVLWLLNEGLHLYIHMFPNYRVISWGAVALVSILVATYLTLYEGHKKGRDVVNLPLFIVVDKFIGVALATMALVYVFYRNGMTYYIPSLMMTMYGLLIISSKHNITSSIVRFGYVSLAGGLIGLLYWPASIPLAAAVLGVGHIILGISLILKKEVN
jgi:hypothetical protein